MLLIFDKALDIYFISSSTTSNSLRKDRDILLKESNNYLVLQKDMNNYMDKDIEISLKNIRPT